MGPVSATRIAELFDRYAAALELYAAQCTTTPADCVQEAFLELARQSMAPNDPAAWLFRVVRNRAINAGRAAARRTKHETTIARWNTLRASDPTDEVILKDLLEQLEDRSREIVVLRLWGGLSWQEIADLTTTSRSAAHRIYTEALAQLRRHLEPPICPPINQINRT